jgi:hypothetical protein
MCRKNSDRLNKPLPSAFIRSVSFLPPHQRSFNIEFDGFTGYVRFCEQKKRPIHLPLSLRLERGRLPGKNVTNAAYHLIRSSNCFISSGSGQENVYICCLNGWKKESSLLCNAWRLISSRLPPYNSSPTSGWPICAK